MRVASKADSSVFSSSGFRFLQSNAFSLSAPFLIDFFWFQRDVVSFSWNPFFIYASVYINFYEVGHFYPFTKFIS